MKNRTALIVFVLGTVLALNISFAAASSITIPFVKWVKSIYNDDEVPAIKVTAIGSGNFHIQWIGVNIVKQGTTQQITHWGSSPSNCGQGEQKKCIRSIDLPGAASVYRGAKVYPFVWGQKDGGGYGVQAATLEGYEVPVLPTVSTAPGSAGALPPNKEPVLELSVDKSSVLKDETVNITANAKVDDGDMRSLKLTITKLDVSDVTYTCTAKQGFECKNEWSVKMSATGTVIVSVEAEDARGAKVTQTKIITVAPRASVSYGLNMIDASKSTVKGVKIQDISGYSSCAKRVTIIKVSKVDNNYEIDYIFDENYAIAQNDIAIAINCQSAQIKEQTQYSGFEECLRLGLC